MVTFRQTVTLPKRSACAAWLSTALFATAILLATGAASVTQAQAPTDAQRAAIKSQCRSDYMAHCSSVPPGGMASLQCLEKNMSSLSAGCADAVHAVQGPSAPKAEETAKSEAAPAAASTESAPSASTPPAAQTESAPAATAPASK